MQLVIKKWATEKSVMRGPTVMIGLTALLGTLFSLGCDSHLRIEATKTGGGTARIDTVSIEKSSMGDDPADDAQKALDSAFSINAERSSFVVNGKCQKDGNLIKVAGMTDASTLCKEGQFAVDVDLTDIEDGALTLDISEESTLGMIIAKDTINVIKDTLPPTFEVVNAPLLINNENKENVPLAGRCSDNGQRILISGAVTAEAYCMGGSFSTSLNFGSVADGSHEIKLDYFDLVGNKAPTVTLPLIKETTPPTVLAVTTDKSDGFYKVGETMEFKVKFSEPVTVTSGAGLGLTVANGAAGRLAPYTSGSGSDTLIFTYTVGAGDTHADLDYIATNALSAGAGSIKDGAGLNANLTLPTPGAIAAAKAIVIDTTAPTAPAAPGFGATFSKSTTVTLNWGAATDNNRSNYNVKLCTTADCSTTCLTATTAPQDAISANLTGENGATYYGCVKASDSAGNLSAWINSANTITVDTTPPAVTSVTSAASDGFHVASAVIDIKVAFSENITVTGCDTINLKLETGATDRTVTGCTVSAPHAVTFSYTVQNGDDNPDLDYHSTAALALGVSGTIRDAAGNDALLTLPALGSAGSLAGAKQIHIDAAPPAPPATVSFSQNYYATLDASLEFTFSPSTDVDKYVAKICTSSDCATGCGTASDHNLSPASFTLTEGVSYYGCVQTVDNAGNSSAFRTSAAALSDLTTPTLELGIERRAGISFYLKPSTLTDTGPVDFTWEQLSGPGVVTFGTPDASGTTLIDATTEGTYGLKLTATDKLGRSASDTVTLEWDRRLALGVGTRANCAIFAGGVLKCWGDNSYGQLGGGAIGTNKQVTVNLGGRSALAVATSFTDFASPTEANPHTQNPNTCVLTEDGSVFCWGRNTFGQLGDGTVTHRATPNLASPVNLGAGRKALAIGVGKASSCALLDDGSIKCWGYNVSNNLLGYDAGETCLDNLAIPVARSCSKIPRQVTGFGAGSAKALAVRQFGGIAIRPADNAAQLWGGGSLTDDALNGSMAGKIVKRVPRQATAFVLCSILLTDQIWCFNQGGDSFPANLNAELTAGTKALQVQSTAKNSLCLLQDDGVVKCWSNNTGANTGLAAVGGSTYTFGGKRALAIQLPAGSSTTDGTHACALLDDFTITCWGGKNLHGQLNPPL